jgi:hypothetical protein
MNSRYSINKSIDVSGIEGYAIALQDSHKKNRDSSSSQKGFEKVKTVKACRLEVCLSVFIKNYLSNYCIQENIAVLVKC